MKKILAILLSLTMLFSVCAFAEGDETVTVTDMIGREVEIIPGSYTRVVCIGQAR